MAPTEASKQAQLMEVLKKEVRAMLIAAKAGLTPEQLEEQYMAMVCKPLPLHDLGFQSTLELVAQMPEVVRICFKNGTLILKAIADDSTKGIAKLVANQKVKTRKPSKKTATRANAPFPTKNSKNPQSFQTLSAGTPVLPARVKAELQDLLSSSPLLLADLGKAFLRRFGRAFQYRQYGFLSVFEVLRSMADSIAVEQTKAGSLLVLRKYLARTIEQEEVPQGKAEEEKGPPGEAEEEEMPQDEAEEEEMPQDEAEEEDTPQGETEEEETPEGEAQEEETPQGEAQEEDMLQATSSAEMPPLEPTCEIQSFHQAAHLVDSEPVQTQAVDLGDHLKQEYEQGGFVAPLFNTGGKKESVKMIVTIAGKVFIQFCPICWDSVIFSHSQGPRKAEQATYVCSVHDETSECHLLLIPLQHQGFEQFPSTPEIPPDAVQDRRLCSLPPLKRRCLVGVIVEFVVSPSQFYIHICSTGTSSKLQDLMFEMRHVYSHKVASDKYIMPESAVRPGQLCCVMVSTWWYRVIIHRVLSDQEVEVFYVDYGHLQIVQKSSLRFLKWHYLKLPAQAIPCSLAWVKPVEGTWSSAAILLFKHLCRFKEFVGIVDEYVDGVLYLFLCDTSTKEDIYFHSVLRDMGYAHICGENIPSQEFKELNPSALYIQPNGKQGNAEVVEPDLCLQQESRGADSETATLKLAGAEL